jgi:hypothetical protein
MLGLVPRNLDLIRETIDLRSDLVSPPPPAMILEITRALEEPLAFDLREDPRQRALEARASSLLGKEDALFFPTCTMANQVAIHFLCRAGETLVADADTHVITSEAGAPAALSGVLVRPLPGRDGHVDLKHLEQAITAPVDPLRSRIGLIVSCARPAAPALGASRAPRRRCAGTSAWDSSASRARRATTVSSSISTLAHRCGNLSRPTTRPENVTLPLPRV